MDDDDGSEPPSPTASSSPTRAVASNSGAATTEASSSAKPTAPTANRSTYVRQFHAGYTGILEVWVRSANNTKLPNISLQRALNNQFQSIASIKPDREKLSVIFGDRAEANTFVRETILQGIVVSIPDSRRVDVCGAVRADDLEGLGNLGLLTKNGAGLFGADGLPPCRILHAEQLVNAQREATNTIKITFEGTLLPKFLGIDNLRIPVRLFWKQPMFCVKCQTHGHTEKLCRRPASCARCGYGHLTADCSNSAVNKTLCPHCAKKHADSRLACPYFQQVTKDFKAKQIASTKQRYQQAVSSIRNANAAQQPRQQAPALNAVNFPPLRNAYASLAADQLDDDAPDDVTTDPNPHAFLPPPKNPYAPRSRTRTPNKRYRDGSTVSRQSAHQQAARQQSAHQQPARQHPARLQAAHQQPSRSQHAINAAAQRQPATQQNQHQPSTAASTRRSAPRRDQSATGTQSATLKVLILALARSSSLSSEWISILEAFIDPLLKALLPYTSEIVAAVTPLMNNIQ